MKYNFSELKDNIKIALDKKIEAGYLKTVPGEEFTLIDGFGITYLKDDTDQLYSLNVPYLITVMVVGKYSGLVYQFPLKALLPDLEF